MRLAPRWPAEPVNFVGEPYAIVIGETLAAARAGVEALETDFEELPAQAVLASAMEGVQIHDGIENNLSFHWALRRQARRPTPRFAAASHITTLTFANNRLIPNAIEPRACVAAYDSAADEITLTTTSQNPHLERLVLAAFVNLAPEHKLRVISPDVGGGFGSKIFVYPGGDGGGVRGPGAQSAGQVDSRPVGSPSSPTPTAATT